MKDNLKKRKCYNCKHSSKGFKIDKLTHHTCLEPEQAERIEKGEHPFEALVVFSSTCQKHEFKV